MTQHGFVTQLLQEHNEWREEVCSFYNSFPLFVRTVLAHWIEQQDWLKVLANIPAANGLSNLQLPESSILVARELLEDALCQLQTKAEGCKELLTHQILYQHAELCLRTKYERNPIDFVKDVADCLEQERIFINRLVALNVPQGSMEEVMEPPTEEEVLKMHLQDVLQKIEEDEKLLLYADIILKRFRSEVEQRNDSPMPIFDFENGTEVVPYKRFENFKQKALGILQTLIVTDVNQLLEYLKPLVNHWKNAKMYQTLCRKPYHARDPENIEQLCTTMCEIVSKLGQILHSTEIVNITNVTYHDDLSCNNIPAPSCLGNLQSSFADLLKKLICMLFVVIQQPPITLLTERETKAEKNKSKRFSTAAGILGGQGFKTDLVLEENEICLCYGEDLAKAGPSGYLQVSRFPVYQDQKGLQKKISRNVEESAQNHIARYDNMRVNAFSRNDGKMVYRQTYHMMYSAVTSFLNGTWKFPVLTFSLPIIFRTGAVQASEHAGTQLCHSFSAENYLVPGAPIAEKMTLMQVISMINERIRFIGGRNLQTYEQELLLEKLATVAKVLPGTDPSQQEITLDAFIKEPLILPQIPGLEEDYEKSKFSLWRWIHSIINLLSNTLQSPWQDGVIYGFASREHCRKALDNQPPGTFLIRFSESTLEGNHENSTGGIAVVLKTYDGVEFLPPIKEKKILKHGLLGVVQNIKVEPFPQYIYNCNQRVEFLKRYQGDITKKVDPRYPRFVNNGIIERFEGLSISGPSSVSAELSPPHNPSLERQPPKKARRRRLDSDDSTRSACGSSGRQSYATSPEATSSLFSEASNSPGQMEDFSAVGILSYPPTSTASTPASPALIPNIPIMVQSIEEIVLDPSFSNNNIDPASMLTDEDFLNDFS